MSDVERPRDGGNYLLKDGQYIRLHPRAASLEESEALFAADAEAAAKAGAEAGALEAAGTEETPASSIAEAVIPSQDSAPSATAAPAEDDVALVGHSASETEPTDTPASKRKRKSEE